MRGPILLLTALTSFHNTPATESMPTMTAENADRVEAMEASAPPLGSYSCFFISFSPHTGLIITPTGMGFILLPDKKYSLPSKPEEIAEYNYDTKSKEISWVSGSL